MKVYTTRFGELEIEKEKVIDMPKGMVGFAERSFIILNADNDGPFCWFQAVDNPDLAFVVVDPFRFVSDYQVKLSREECDCLQVKNAKDVVILSVVTMNRDPWQITVNLQGPVVINPACMTSFQVVLDGNYPARYLLFGKEQVPEKEERILPPQARAPRLSSISCELQFAPVCA